MAIFAGMKAFRLSFSLLFVISLTGHSQSFEVFPDTLQFGYVSELSIDSQMVKVYNRTPTPIELDVFLAKAVYGDQAIRVASSLTQVPALDTARLWVRFAPQHNVSYEGDILMGSSNGGGALVLYFNGHGRYSNSYYSSTEGLSEEALKSALKVKLAQNFNSLSYNAARDNMYASIDNVGGQVECVYTGRTATFNNRPGANNNNFNCEHTFPQGFFSQAQPMRADIHHLFPTDASTNSRRSNHPFGVVSNPTWTGGGSKYGSSTFEPRDAHKGAAARAMMYFVIRYQDYNNFFAPQENILLQWHRQFQPAAFEIGRNNDIYQLQNNRNPFVDYPQFADRINNFVSNSTAEVEFNLGYVNDTLHLPFDPNETYRVYYRTAVVNLGNQPIFVAPQPFANSDIDYANGTNLPETLLPGESKTIELFYAYNADLSAGGPELMKLQTNLPTGDVNIYLESGAFDLSGMETEAAMQESIYPNPANGILHIPAHTDRVELIDQWGRVVLSSSDESIDVSEVPEGTYAIRMYQEGTINVQSLIIARN